MLAQLLRWIGKTYIPDDRIPSSLVLIVTSQRILSLLRGLIRVRSKVFIGRHVTLRGGWRIRFANYVTIEDGCRIDGYSETDVTIGTFSKIGAWSVVSCTSHFSKFGKGLKIGNNSGFGEYCYFGAAGGIDIGSDVIAGQYVSFHSENHNFSAGGQKIREQGVVQAPIKIGNDVWIGAKATFLAGSEIGDHSVVAAGAVVTDRFGPNSLIAGVPARLIRKIGE